MFKNCKTSEKLTEMSTEDYLGGMLVNDTANSNVTSLGRNSTSEMAGTISLNFVDSFVKALSVMIVSELGDKTFFLAGQNKVSIAKIMKYKSFI